MKADHDNTGGSDVASPARLTPELLGSAMKQAGTRPLQWLGEAMQAEESAVLVALAGELRCVHFEMPQLRELVLDFNVIPFGECQRRGCVAGRMAPQGPLFLVVADPLDGRLQTWLEMRTRQARCGPTALALSRSADLQARLAMAESKMRAMDGVLDSDLKPEAAGSALKISIAGIDATQSPVVRLVDSTLHDALRVQASDIHLETSATGLAIKYRVDGVLELVKEIDNLEWAHQAISRIKVVAELDISERRIPQDGRFKVTADGREIDFRVSIMPNLHGEDAVLRVLDRKHLTGQFAKLTLGSLSFDATVCDFIRELARRPYGLLLVTGPTGSGKTTTLYAALSEINTGIDKIITIEDPIEYQLHGVLQIPVNDRKGLTFARGLRSVLRHDPDKIMVGEIRDSETAQIAVQAALTGHQVFTTVHANNVFDVIGRFANMGVDTYSLVSALNGVVAQRLLRGNCVHCATPYEPAQDELKRSRIAPDVAAGARFMRGQGCANCRGSGYKGRRAVAEMLQMTDALRAALVDRASLHEIKQSVRRDGFVSLHQAAVALALSGLTTVEEVNRVTQVD